MLIIGCGNPDRADDAAGLLVARRLNELGVPASEHAGDPLDLVETWAGETEVIVIDAVVSGAAPGTLITWDATASPLPPERFQCSTHAFGLSEAIELSRVLNRLPGKLIVCGIEAESFEPGGAVSSAVSQAIEATSKKLKSRNSRHSPIR